MSGIATAVVASAVIGGYVAIESGDAMADAAKDGAQASRAASAENIAWQKEVFDQQREDAAPWRDAGVEALGQLQEGMADGSFDMSSFNFKADPGYQFRLDEGIKALDRSASSRGRLLSGGQDRAVTRYASDLASQEYANAFARKQGEKINSFSRLATVSGIGQSANSLVSGARDNMGSSVSSSIVNAGNANANAAYNTGDARASAYRGMGTSANQGVQNYLLYEMMK